MGAVYEEFERELAEIQSACGGDPRREVVRLFLMALEREELVSVGYRESLMERRLATLPIPDEAREVIRHALIWIWKDEEMHTIYIRGAILKIGGWRLKTQAFLTQVAGALGGWAGSVLQHTRWTSAPVSRTAASLITAIGGLVGKVPTEVRQHLQFGPFRNFCLFNIDAEKTAAVCWSRIAELSESNTGLDAELTRDFKRIAHDEERHEKLFQLIAESLNENDELCEGVTTEGLVDRIREIGEEYLPRKQRLRSNLDNPIGSGQPVFVEHSNERGDKRRLFRDLLDHAELADAIRRRAEHLGRSVESLTVCIKPTFMLGYHHKDLSPLTDVELVKDLAAFLRELGCQDVVIIEGRNIYDRFYSNRSVRDVAEYFGLADDAYRLADTADEQVDHEYRRGMAQYTIAETWRDADFRISFPKLRSHPIEMALLSVGNVEWVGGRCDEYLFVERQADRTTAVMMLLDEFPPHFAIIDGFENAPDGLVGVMGCPRPREPKRFYAGADALAVDTIVLRHLGVDALQQGSLIRSAVHWFGGSGDAIEVIGEDSAIEKWRGPYANEWRALLSMMAYPVYVLGSGRGALFVPEMDEQAFPPSKRIGWSLGLRRRAVRRLLGLHIPAGAQQR